MQKNLFSLRDDVDTFTVYYLDVSMPGCYGNVYLYLCFERKLSEGIFPAYHFMICNYVNAPLTGE